MGETYSVPPSMYVVAPVSDTLADRPTVADKTRCARCGGTDGRHGLVHVRHGNGGGGNRPCPRHPHRPKGDPMSTCISRHGEYSTHEPDGDYTCTLCGVLDEDALRAELRTLRARGADHDRQVERQRQEYGSAWDELVPTVGRTVGWIVTGVVEDVLRDIAALGVTVADGGV